MKQPPLKNGTRVRLTGQHDNRELTVTAYERHNGTTFYRMKELLGALFPPSSFEVVK